MTLYPSKVQKRCDLPRYARAVTGENGRGTDASLVCGSFVRFSMRIDPATKLVEAVGFQTNGCGFMIAAADVLAQSVQGRKLGDLHALDENDLRLLVSERLGFFDEGRKHCSDCCIDTLRAAFADYRSRQIEEFRGEKGLICTCFGVTEETIERHIDGGLLKTVDEVTLVCNAGGGCGSCRMLIQEMLDSDSDLRVEARTSVRA